MQGEETMKDTIGLWRLAWRAGVFAASVLVLAGCAGVNRTDRPAQVEERATSAPRPSVDDSDVRIAAYTPPARPRYARPVPTRAVAVLMRKADDQSQQGELDAASISLERALRIAPDDPVLWHRLAEVRMVQQRHDLVVQLAAKSNALTSPRDHRLLSSNWQLIARSRRALGDATGAREAERRAAALR